MLPSTESPFPQFFDLNGTPLDEGSIYYGLPNTNPVTSPLQVFWDAAGTQPAAQPIKTLNGVPVRFGTPANVFTDQIYSISVYDKKGRLIFTEPDSTEWDWTPLLANNTDVSLGSALIGYKPPFTNSTGRTVSDRLSDYVSAKDFGLDPANAGSVNNAAMVKAIAYAIEEGGLTLHIPRGTYNFASTINLLGANNLRITGDGIDATVLQINHATTDFITVGGDIYQTIDNLTITSSVNRTAGAMFKTTGFWRRGMIFRVKVSKHFNGIDMFQFEHCTLMETNIVTPTGAGTALIVGNPAATNQGANLNLVTVFIRGNDETVPEGPAVGARGILVYDIEAIYGFNVDISAFLNEIMVVGPTFQTANCFFTSCYFDITVGGDNILFQGAGIKNRIQFSNCWIAGAGRFGAGAADKFGVRFADAGSYISLAFDACEFIGTSGPGFGTFTPQSEVLFTGCTFNNCGLNTTLDTAVYGSFAVAQTKAMQFTGCKFIPSLVTHDFVFTANARGNIITGCELLRGVNYQSGAQFGYVHSNSDPNTTDSVASAATIQISPTKSFYFVTGAVNIGGLFRTYTGHQVNFVPITGFTWLNGGALALKGSVNFVAAAGSVLTLQCMNDGTWREISRSV